MSSLLHSPGSPAPRRALLVMLAMAGCRAVACPAADDPFTTSLIDRLPPIDAVDFQDPGLEVGPPGARVGSRLNNDPLPPTGSDFGIFRPEATYNTRMFPPQDDRFADRLGGKPDLVILPKLQKNKQGFFQKLDVTATYLDGGRVGDMGITELETYVTVALPFPTTRQPLLISPNFEARFLDGPLAPDVPGTVYSAYAQFLWLPKIGDRWLGIFGIEPGWYGDYETSSADYFRLLGRALVRYEFVIDRLQLVAGFLYLDRDDISVLPAGGIIWMPTDDWEFEFIYPKPKIAYRLRPAYSGRRAVEWWTYFGAEFGGDTWTVQRTGGETDRLTLFDVRVYLGLDRRLDGGSSLRLELGWVFARKLSYRSTAGDIDFPATLMLRAGTTY